MNIELSSKPPQRPHEQPPAPWRGGEHGVAPRFEPVRVVDTHSEHCVSVCLFSEPEWKKRFPSRDFRERFLSKANDARTRLAALGYSSVIFCDREMEQLACDLRLGSVYRVTHPPAFPFAQHIWRYLAVLLPPHPTIRAYHFRGMDNLLLSKSDVQLFELLLRQQLDVLHEPYLRHKGRHYTPVRGSCSVAREGIASLAWWLQEMRHYKPEGNDWVDAWHSDEAYLEGWFQQSIAHLRPLTVIDRELPMEFYWDLWKRNQSARTFHIVRREQQV